MNELKTHNKLHKYSHRKIKYLVFCCGETTNQQARARASGVIAESVCTVQLVKFSAHAV
jgi:hypothetical protein